MSRGHGRHNKEQRGVKQWQAIPRCPSCGEQCLTDECLACGVEATIAREVLREDNRPRPRRAEPPTTPTAAPRYSYSDMLADMKAPDAMPRSNASYPKWVGGLRRRG